MRRFTAIFLLLATASVVVGKTRVVIRGNETKSESELLYLIGGRLAHVENDKASPSRADDAAFLLMQVMRKDGYAQVQVTPQVVGPDEILLTIREGGRLSLGDVQVEGVGAEDGNRLPKVFAGPASKDRPIGSGSAPFREEDVPVGLALVVQDLNALGYWSAQAAVESRKTDDKGRVDLVIRVDQGPLYKIGSPVITTASGEARSLTTEHSGRFVGRDATTANISAMRNAVTESFTKRGYSLAKVTMGRTLDGARFIPDFNIDMGRRLRVRNIEVDGLDDTEPKHVMARLGKYEGEWYDQAAMNDRLREFLGTGAFSSVRLETEEVGGDYVDVMLHMEEAKAKEISFGAGFGSYEGGIFRTTYTDRNLWGQMVSFSSGLELSARGVLGEVKLVNPWLFGSDYSMTSRVYALVYGHEGYASTETGFDVKFARTYAEHFSTELLLGYSLVNTSGDGLDLADMGETVYFHPRVSLTQSIDYRDNPVLPKTGWHLKMPLQLGAAVGDISTSYVKGGVAGGWYHPLGKTYQLGLGGSFNFIVPSGDSMELPIDLRLFNGGARSVRSFPERELGPKSPNHDYPIGGQASWVVNAEVTRPIAGVLRGVAFVDAGTLSRSLSDLGSAEVEVAAGLGVRLDLPIGPVRLEYGYNLTRDADEPTGALHFAIGVAF